MFLSISFSKVMPICLELRQYSLNTGKLYIDVNSHAVFNGQKVSSIKFGKFVLVIEFKVKSGHNIIG